MYMYRNGLDMIDVKIGLYLYRKKINFCVLFFSQNKVASNQISWFKKQIYQPPIEISGI